MATISGAEFFSIFTPGKKGCDTWVLDKSYSSLDRLGHPEMVATSFISGAFAPAAARSASPKPRWMDGILKSTKPGKDCRRRDATRGPSKAERRAARAAAAMPAAGEELEAARAQKAEKAKSKGNVQKLTTFFAARSGGDATVAASPILAAAAAGTGDVAGVHASPEESSGDEARRSSPEDGEEEGDEAGTGRVSPIALSFGALLLCLLRRPAVAPRLEVHGRPRWPSKPPR